MHRLSDVACAVPAGHPCHLVDRGGARCFVVFLACVDGRGRGSRGGRSGRATPTAGGDQRQQGGEWASSSEHSCGSVESGGVAPAIMYAHRVLAGGGWGWSTWKGLGVVTKGRLA